MFKSVSYLFTITFSTASGHSGLCLVCSRATSKSCTLNPGRRWSLSWKILPPFEDSLDRVRTDENRKQKRKHHIFWSGERRLRSATKCILDWHNYLDQPKETFPLCIIVDDDQCICKLASPTSEMLVAPRTRSVATRLRWGWLAFPFFCQSRRRMCIFETCFSPSNLSFDYYSCCCFRGSWTFELLLHIYWVSLFTF